MSVTSIKEFTFRDLATSESLSVRIPEVVDASYGLYVWPSAPVLAQYTWLHRHKVRGKSVLEIGAGTGLPGIVAAKCGARVTLSDSVALPQCRDRCRSSAEANGLSDVSVMGITWGFISPDLMDLPSLDLILASDCFYDTKDFEDVVMTLSCLLHQNPHAEVWCAYQVRSPSKTIELLLSKWKLRGEQVPLPDMTTVQCSVTSHAQQEVLLFALRLNTAAALEDALS
ncbi:methyltransferase-like protein 23 [Aplysia californica]|uniref:Methyltransferase-like protein 23 n=1 Tax=Aplysia californica TaxID=6500 RepID=A0ABM0JRY9_APLCA|nr:methyltransferase-like protein 23 [Aplysia californica]XP_005100170.1 methyltransferase-like protein 23 [Aplysia californica]